MQKKGFAALTMKLCVITHTKNVGNNLQLIALIFDETCRLWLFPISSLQAAEKVLQEMDGVYVEVIAMCLHACMCAWACMADTYHNLLFHYFDSQWYCFLLIWICDWVFVDMPVWVCLAYTHHNSFINWLWFSMISFPFDLKSCVTQTYRDLFFNCDSQWFPWYLY